MIINNTLKQAFVTLLLTINMSYAMEMGSISQPNKGTNVRLEAALNAYYCPDRISGNKSAHKKTILNYHQFYYISRDRYGLSKDRLTGNLYMALIALQDPFGIFLDEETIFYLFDMVCKQPETEECDKARALLCKGIMGYKYRGKFIDDTETWTLLDKAAQSNLLTPSDNDIARYYLAIMSTKKRAKQRELAYIEIMMKKNPATANDPRQAKRGLLLNINTSIDLNNARSAPSSFSY